MSILALLGPNLAGVASAGLHTWTSSGPEGGNVIALAIDPSAPATVYAGAFGFGVFKSINGGQSWTAVNSGLANTGVRALAIDPSAPDTLYAGTLSNGVVASSGGVFKSGNGGGTWTAANSGLTNMDVFALAIDPSATATLYAGTGGGVFKSNNGGQSWTAVNSALTNVLALVINPSAPATVYAGTLGGGVFKSSNGGQSWTAVNSGLTNTEVWPMALDPSSPTTLYAGTASGGVFKSTDGGGTWNPVNSGLTNTDIRALAIDPSSPGTLYAGTDRGIFKSTDGGGNWNAVNSGLTNTGVRVLAINPTAPTRLYAGTSGSGAFKSSDGGQSWTAINSGLNNTDVRGLAIDPSAPATLYAVGGGVFRSIDGSQSWTTIHSDLNNTDVYAVAVDPSAPATLYAGTQAGVSKSSNGGQSWTSSLTNAVVDALVIDPSTPATLYAGTVECELCTVDPGIFKSVNGGQSWTSSLTNTDVHALAIDPSAPATLYAGTFGGGVFKSSNGGGTWTAVNAGLTDMRVFALAIDSSAPATLYAGTNGGVFKSSNGGQSWTSVNSGLTNTGVRALAIDPSAPATLYAGTVDGVVFPRPGEGAVAGGVFRSTDAGGSWTPINAGLTNRTVRALAINPLTPTRLYAGTDAGVYEVHDYLVIEPCLPDATTLCVSGGRFKVTTQWATADGGSGFGQAVSLAGGDTGYFTFFDRANVEVAVKILNGCGSNGHFWTFAGGLTNVGVVMTVTDSRTGAVKTYTNPQGTAFQPIQDTSAFASCGAGSTAGIRRYDGSVAASLPPPGVSESLKIGVTEPCVANATTLCLSSSRYQVQAQWATSDGASGAGHVINLTGDTGAFWFFSQSNIEVVVKVLNACGVNGRYWTFAGGLTNVHVILTVTDTRTGTVQTYTNPQETPFEPIQSTDAFTTCP